MTVALHPVFGLRGHFGASPFLRGPFYASFSVVSPRFHSSKHHRSFRVPAFIRL